MRKAKHYDQDGRLLGEVDLPEEAFGAEPNGHVLWQSVKVYQANQRQGNAATKTRSMVSGGNTKPWKQKGTGRARHGTTRSPIWVGGATTFGPRPRDYTQTLPKKVKRLALISAMSQRASEGNVAVVNELSFPEPKTGSMARFMAAAGLGGRKVCLITAQSQPTVVKSCRNIPGLGVLTRNSMNVYDLMNAEVLVFTVGALEGLKEAYAT
jgi:large subunit ribosomal protein L4